MSYLRGDIYYVNHTKSVGSEQRSGRPAIIVSNNSNNQHSHVVEVVYLTTRHKPNLLTHVGIHSTGMESTALCEQVHSVDCERLGSYCGRCTPSELDHLNAALLVSLGLSTAVRADEGSADERLIATQARLEILQELYEKLLHRVSSTT